MEKTERELLQAPCGWVPADPWRSSLDDSQSYPAHKPEAPVWLVNSDKPDSVPHEREKAKNNGAKEIVPLLHTPLPCPLQANCQLAQVLFLKPLKCLHLQIMTSFPWLKMPTKQAWKRSITHVYMSHVIQMHLNKEKASQNQVKPEESSHIRTSRSPNGSTLHKNNAQKIVSVTPLNFYLNLLCCFFQVSGNFLNLPISTMALPGAQHVQYLQAVVA
ncbi:uncharacterized protein LOC133927279 isoform X2 [Phragmites australis]|uniref:uncharacterized protein LOC133927279 isoform X2 n=1 Tax=Phragmites australis TaxID=29695 RepID=UPI002D791728|nr:uncharacterized protein LOC133927279 isoform X2 [Phragmites australis]